MHSYILLDRSGSMSTRWTEALSSINAYVKGLKEVPGDYRVTVATFDSNNSWSMPSPSIAHIKPATTFGHGAATVGHSLYPTATVSSTFDLIRNNVRTELWQDISQSEVQPRGGTPLYDATAKLVNLARSQNPDRAVLVIMTDGEENASTEIKNPGVVKAVLDEVRAKNWQVIFLGADFENQRQAASMGARYENTVQTKGARGLVAGMADTSAMASAYFTTGNSMSYSTASRNRAKGLDDDTDRDPNWTKTTGVNSTAKAS